MNVVDSSGWIEFLSNDPGADAFAPLLSAEGELLIPTIVVTEVLRWLHSHGRTSEAVETLRSMSLSELVPLSAALAELAAELGIRHKLPLADSIIYATARASGATLWTQDRDFEGLPGVHYIPKA